MFAETRQILPDSPTGWLPTVQLGSHCGEISEISGVVDSDPKSSCCDSNMRSYARDEITLWVMETCSAAQSLRVGLAFAKTARSICRGSVMGLL